MRLIERGALDLDSPIDRWLTRWRLPDSAFDRHGVTVRRLLSHTAGLSLHGYGGFRPNLPLPSVEESLLGATAGAGDVRLALEPGNAFVYSGGGYTILQLLIEEVAGQDFETFMGREVLDPLGMADSGFALRADLERRLATGHDVAGTPLPNYRFTAKAAAGLYASVADLTRFLAAGLPGHDGRAPGRGVVSREGIATMFSAAPGTDGVYGFGYQTITTDDGVRVVMHSGANRGWKALFAAIVGRAEGMAVLTNGDNGHEIILPLACAWSEEAAGAALPIC